MWQLELEKAWEKPQRKRKRRVERAAEIRRVGKRSRVGVVVNWEVSEVEDEDEEGDEGPRDEGEDRDVEQEQRSADGPPVSELWNSNQLALHIKKASLKYIGVRLNIIGWRHRSKGIWRWYIHNPKARSAYMDAEEDEGALAKNSEQGEKDELFDLQTGHSSRIANTIYGRSVYEPMFSSESKRFGFRVASSEWHAFLELPSAMEKKPGQGTVAAEVRKEGLAEERRRWRKLRLLDLDRELKRLLGPTAEFRSVQRPALEAITQHESYVVAVIGTGAGKSVLFMLPAMVSSGLTIVVVPLVALWYDMKERCTKLGITCAKWDSQRLYVRVQIMFVTPESAVGEAFWRYMRHEHEMGWLDRVVVDECHTPLDSVKGFRSRLLGLGNLVRLGVQMVYLTTTLRPKEEPLFIELMGLPDKSQCGWFQGRTTRKNVRYLVHEYDREDEEQAIVALVERLKARYPLPGQVVVYCGTVERTVRMAEVLGAVSFH